MHLTHEQANAIGQGAPVRLTLDGMQCVIILEDVYDRLKGALGLDPDQVYDLIESVMAEDDANDPGLDSYQVYK